MCLKDKVKGHEEMKGNGGLGGHTKVKEPCKRYNIGKCTYGKNCIFEHRCSVKKCNKFGHGVHICCLRNADSGVSLSVTGQAAANSNNANVNSK